MLSKNERFLDPIALLWPLCLLIVLLFAGKFSYAGEFDPDEGVNLIKGHLHAEGFKLYDEIWSDQPALATLGISWVIQLFGSSLAAVRGLFFLFCSLLLVAFYSLLAPVNGRVIASLTTIFLILSPFFIHLSTAIMIGLPAITFALLSTWVLYLSMMPLLEEGGQVSLWGMFLSGCLMGVAAQIKLFVVILFPAVLIFILVLTYQNVIAVWIKDGVKWGVIWGGGVVVIYGFVAVTIGPFNLDSIFFSHFQNEPNLSESLIDPGLSNLSVFYYIAPFLLFGLIGLLFGFKRGIEQAIFPAVWAACSLIFIVFHSPTWYHHTMMLLVPLTWLGGLGMGEIYKEYVDKAGEENMADNVSPPSSIGSIAVLCLLVLLMFIFFPQPVWSRLPTELEGNKREVQYDVVSEISGGRSGQGFIFVDRPIYAFLSDRPVPPEFAVLTIKRLQTKNIDQVEMIDALEDYQVEYILLERFTDNYEVELYRYIEAHYDAVPLAGDGKFFRRRDMGSQGLEHEEN